MKKTILLALLLLPSAAFADGITDGMGIAGDTIFKYTPAVRSLGFALACIIGVIAAFSIYYAIQNNDPNTKKKIITYAGSCFTILSMSYALPQFFNYQESGLIAQNPSGNNSSSSNGNFIGGDDYDDIITDIPPLNNPNWHPDPNFPTFPGGGNGNIIVKPDGNGNLTVIPGGGNGNITVKPGNGGLLEKL